MLYGLAGGTAGLMSAIAAAAPSGEQVVSGQATFERAGTLTTITAGNNAIINYRSFDIASNEGVRFVQPDATSRVLNRIQSSEPTRIDGSLQANGIVYLVNPAGVMFGRSSIVNVSGLFAAAGNISNDEFLSGVNHFSNISGPIICEGLISARDVALVAKRIENHGEIVADAGLITAVIGNDVYIREAGSRVYVRIDGRDIDPDANPAAGAPGAVAGAGEAAGIRNTGTISANGGLVTLGAGDTLSLAIHNTGTIQSRGGRVDATAQRGTIRNDGRIDVGVDSGIAGTANLRAPLIAVPGVIDARAQNGVGGRINIVSSTGTLIDGSARILASGGAGLADGGNVLIHSINGDTFVGKLVVVDISGGTAGGHGGQLEISARKRLGLYGTVLGNAAAGFKAGSVLIDPQYIVIATPGTGDGTLADGYVLGGDGGDVFVISPDAIESFVGDVRLEATLDIGILENLSKVNGGLFLRAGRDIRFASVVGPGSSSVCGNYYPVPSALTVRASSVDLQAGGSIRDMARCGTSIYSTDGNIRLVALGGVVEYGLLSAPSRRGVIIQQAQSLVFDPRKVRSTASAPVSLDLLVTNGSLSFGGSGCYAANASYVNFTAQASGNVTLNAPVSVEQNASLLSRSDVIIKDNLRAGGAVVLHAGQDGSGTLRFAEDCLQISGSSITLAAGNGTGTSASVDARTHSPTFTGPGGGNTRPSSFALIQDAGVTDANLPRLTQFRAPLDGMAYRIESRGAGVTLTDPSLVRNTALTLASATTTTIAGNLSLLSLDVIGSSLLRGNVSTATYQDYAGPVVVSGNRTLSAGGLITFDSSVDAHSDAAPDSLTILADVMANGPIGANSPLQNLFLGGDASLCGGYVGTVGGQTYDGNVTLCVDTILESTSGADIVFNGTVDGTSGGDAEGLTILGGLVANAPIGNSDPLDFLSVSGRSLLNGGSVVTLHDQTYSGPVTLGTDTTLLSQENGTISFGSSVDGTPDGEGESLTVLGNLHAEGPIGATTPLEFFGVGGNAEICGGIVTTTGAQTYDGGVVLCNDTTFTSLSGANITFKARVDGTTPGQESMTVNGHLIAGGAIGSIVPLEFVDVNGPSDINGGLVHTTGFQDYSGPVVLGANTAMISDTGATIAFGSSVDSGTGAPVSLDITGGMAANGPIGAGAPLSSLSVSGDSMLCGGLVRTIGDQAYLGSTTLCVDTTLESLSGGNITLGGPVNGTPGGEGESLTILGDLIANGPIGNLEPLESLSVSGSAEINGGLVATTGGQDYAGPVVIGADTTMQSTPGGTIVFHGPVDAALDADGESLTILGDLIAEGPIGASNALESLVVSGDAELCGGYVRTQGAQTYGGSTTLCVDTILESVSGADVTFGGPVNGTPGDGAESLTILGGMVANGPIGNLDPLESLSISGASSLNGGLIATIGDQNFGGAVTLGADALLRTSGTVTFGGSVDAAPGGEPASLAIEGDLHAEGPIGANVPLGSLDVTGDSEICGGSVTTVLGQHYGGDVVLCQDTTLASTSGDTITFDGAVDGTTLGEESLTIAGQLVANGPIGTRVALESLSVSGASRLNGGDVRTAGAQFYNGPVLLGASTVLSSDLLATITFNDAVDSVGGPQHLAVLGDMIANGAIGANSPLDSLLVSGNSMLCGGSVTTVQGQDYGGDVLLCVDTVLTSTSQGLIHFRGDVDSVGTRDASLTINGAMQLDGQMGATDHVESLLVNGPSAINGGLVRTLLGQRYGGAVTLGADTRLANEGSGDIYFGSTIDSAPDDKGGFTPRDLTIVTTPRETDDGLERGRIIFNGDIGSNGALRDISLCTDGDQEIDDVPTIATIIGMQSMTITSRDFVMCPNEKFTTLGSLTINASRKAVLSDLVTIDAMTVTSPSIILQRRRASSLVTRDGSLTNDRGLDFVAGGEMAFNGLVSLVGSGPNPTFSSGSGNRPASLARFEFTRTPDGDASLGSLVRDGVVLDQKTRGSDNPPPPPDDVTADLAGIIRRPQFADSVIPRAYDLNAMARLNLDARPVSTMEALAAIRGPYVYNDLPATVEGFSTEERILAATRVDLGAVLRAVDRYNALSGAFRHTGTCVQPGIREGSASTPDAQLNAIAGSINESAERYRATGGAWEPRLFRQYVETTPSERPTLDRLELLAELVRSLNGMGLPTLDFERSRSTLLGPLADATQMSMPELMKLLEPATRGGV